MRYLLTTLLLTLVMFSGCSTKIIPKETIIKVDQMKIVRPNKEMLKRIKVPAPISVEEYLSYPPIVRESILATYNVELLTALKKANYKLKAVNVFLYKAVREERNRNRERLEDAKK